MCIDEESSQTKTDYFCISVQVLKMNQFHGLYVYWTIHMHAWHQQHAINGIRCTLTQPGHITVSLPMLGQSSFSGQNLRCPL